MSFIYYFTCYTNIINKEVVMQKCISIHRDDFKDKQQFDILLKKLGMGVTCSNIDLIQLAISQCQCYAQLFTMSSKCDPPKP